MFLMHPCGSLEVHQTPKSHNALIDVSIQIHQICVNKHGHDNHIKFEVQRRRAGCTQVVAAARSAPWLFAAGVAAVVFYTRADGFVSACRKGSLLPAVRCACNAAAGRSVCMQRLPATYTNPAYVLFSSTKVTSLGTNGAACTVYPLYLARDAVYVRFFSMQILSPTSGTFRRRVCCCLPFGVHALSTCCAQDAVYVRFCSIQILFLRSGTFRKFIMKPQVTLSFPPVYCFQRYELTYLPAEIFLTDHSTPISKEIIVSHHTRAIITRSWFETALNYKPRILDSKNEELPLFST